MSVLAMAEEISNQTQDLPRFASQLRKKHLPKIQPSRLIFAGSGDSYAAAVFAQELSQGESTASDPYELLTNIRRIRGKNLVIISVSGRTKTNIELARKAKRISTNTLAITANLESPLAGECDETLQLQYRTTGTPTSGTISFTTSLLACAFLLRNLPRTVQVKTAPIDTAGLATKLNQAGKGAFVFAGSGADYALSLYGAAKINEVLGAKAEVVYPEQLGHAKLFTIDKKRDFVVCISSGRDKARETYQLLIKEGFQGSIIAFPDSHVVNRSLKIAIYLQRLALSLARIRGIEECAFLYDKSRLSLSNRMIY
ncbi:SIS domain-containing protein [Candidatus Bathyarchaeota archaeon]|nr:MAG: SIS domain-containing protein [Candidatus Bathyarchaeota archaeon]